MQQSSSGNDSKLKVAYILGSGHSGTTLLNLLLGTNQHIFSGGHLHRYKWLYSQHDLQPCGCGSTVAKCAFWNAVKERLETSNQAPNANSPVENPEEICALYRSILTVSGASVICENSRSLSYLNLLLSGPFDVFLIHVVRDGRAVQFSHTRKGRRNPTNLIYWVIYNLREHFRHRGGRNYALVKYEDLVKDPLGITSQLSSRIAGYFDDANLITTPEEGGVFRFDNHIFAGNRMRHKGSQTVRFDGEYLSAIPPHRWMLQTALIAPALIKFGYPLRRRI